MLVYLQPTLTVFFWPLHADDQVHIVFPKAQLANYLVRQSGYLDPLFDYQICIQTFKIDCKRFPRFGITREEDDRSKNRNKSGKGDRKLTDTTVTAIQVRLIFTMYRELGHQAYDKKYNARHLILIIYKKRDINKITQPCKIHKTKTALPVSIDKFKEGTESRDIYKLVAYIHTGTMIPNMHFLEDTQLKYKWQRVIQVKTLYRFVLFLNYLTL